MQLLTRDQSLRNDSLKDPRIGGWSITTRLTLAAHTPGSHAPAPPSPLPSVALTQHSQSRPTSHSGSTSSLCPSQPRPTKAPDSLRSATLWPHPGPRPGSHCTSSAVLRLALPTALLTSQDTGSVRNEASATTSNIGPRAPSTGEPPFAHLRTEWGCWCCLCSPGMPTHVPISVLSKPVLR